MSTRADRAPRLRQGRLLAAACLVLPSWAASAAEPVTLKTAKVDGRDVFKLENYRVKLAIDPARGGAITSYLDKLAPVELVSHVTRGGLCMDHFQEQMWPGEFLEAPYEYKILKQTPEEVQIMLWRQSSGIWRAKLPNKKTSNILLEKTYSLRAGSPAVTCSVKLTAPADEAKVFSYWMQSIFFAGGDYHAVTDRTFRPSTRGVRSTGAEGNGPWGREIWMRDFSDGWMVLLDTEKGTGLATMTDYNALSISYANAGNQTNEPMFRTTYLPPGRSRTYTFQLTPVIGLKKMMYAGRELLVGYAITTDNKGSGKVDFFVERSARAVRDVKFDVIVHGVLDGKKVSAGAVEFGPLTDQPQQRSLSFTNGPTDPVVVRVTATGHTVGAKEFTVKFEDFFCGAYKWADNIRTDMRTPVYKGARPPQKLDLAKPEKLTMRRKYRARQLFFQGLLDEDYNVAGAVHSTGYSSRTTVIHYRYDGSWRGDLTDFPYDYDELLSYSCIILGGVSASGLKPIGLEMLHDYLLAGGGMVVLGSHGAYGRSQLKGTGLGDAFPVEFGDKVFALESTGGKPVARGPDQITFLKYKSLSDKAACYFIHPTRAKPGAKVLMQVDGKPFMVAGAYGRNKARIVCILGAPMGDPKKGQIPFWRDRSWYLILRNAIWWVSRERDHFPEG